MDRYDWRDRIVDWHGLSEAERDEIGLVMPEDGRLIVLNMPNERYHRSEGVSASQVKRLFKSAHHFRHGGGGEETDDMRFGTLCHHALLEPEKLNEDHYALLPQVEDNDGKLVDLRRDKRTRAYQEFLAELGERQEVRAREWHEARELALRVRKDPTILGYLADDASERLVEVSVYWKDPRTQILCRCRPDLLIIPNDEREGLLCLDLKTTKDASEAAIQYYGERYGKWPFTSAWYTDGLREAFIRSVSWGVIAAEKHEHGEVLLYLYDRYDCRTAVSQIGHAQKTRLLNRLAECREGGSWPKQHEGFKQMEPSRYLTMTEEPEIDEEPF